MNYSVNIYKSIKDATTNTKVDLIKFLTTTKYKETVELHRKTYNETGSKHVKNLLPLITPSCTFSKREIASAEDYQQLICIDIDNISEDKLVEVKRELRDYSEVLFMARSVSGDGLFVIIKTDCDVSGHLDAYLKLEEWFLEEFDVTTDAACKDITRLRCASYDADYYYNPEATGMSVPPMVLKPKTDQANYTVKSTKKFNFNVEEYLQKCYDGYSYDDDYGSGVIEGFSSGSRNHWTYKRACKLKEEGLSFNDATVLLQQFGQQDFTANEIYNTVNSAYKRI